MPFLLLRLTQYIEGNSAVPCYESGKAGMVRAAEADTGDGLHVLLFTAAPRWILHTATSVRSKFRVPICRAEKKVVRILNTYGKRSATHCWNRPVVDATIHAGVLRYVPTSRRKRRRLLSSHGGGSIAWRGASPSSNFSINFAGQSVPAT